MSIRLYKSYTPGTRNRALSGFSEITKSKPEKNLIKKNHRNKGRNNRGVITIRHRGGGHKRRYRIIDFKRNKYGVKGIVAAIEYDPNRNSRIALIHYKDGELVAGNKSLGNFRLDGIPGAERGLPQIEVTFDIDVDGILSVKAKEKETGIEQSVTIQGASNLNETEVETMLQDAEKFAAIDKEKRETINLKNQAETLCLEAEKEVNLSKDTIPKDKQENITKLIKEVRNAIQTDNLNSLQSSVENLKKEMRELVNAKVENESNVNSGADLNDL